MVTLQQTVGSNPMTIGITIDMEAIVRTGKI